MPEFLNGIAPSTTLRPSPAAPLRGRKGTAYEGGTRIPFVAAWARTNDASVFQKRIPVPKNSRLDAVVTLHDIFPTVMELAGVPFTNKVDGCSLLPYLKGQPGIHGSQQFITHFPHSRNDSFYSTLRQDNWKAIYRYTSQRWEMYNLADDIGEANNLALRPSPENESRLTRMAALLMAELERCKAQYPVETASGHACPPVMPDFTHRDGDSGGRAL